MNRTTRRRPLESLRHDVTPAGVHYCLIHFDIPDFAPPWYVTGFGNNAAHRVAVRVV